METADLKLAPAQLFIAGKWEDSSNGATFLVKNPATEETIAEVADASPDDGQRAVEAANAAQDSFAAMPPQDRSNILIKAHSILLSRKEELATIMTAEMGKPLIEARGEVEYSAGYLQWFAHEGIRCQGSHSQSPSGRGQIVLSREPVGVSLLVTPWNFPLAMGARKLAPAIATGCSTVVKPAQPTPLTMLFLAQLFQEAGLPAGALNVVPTSQSGSLTEPILAKGSVRHLSFTGSTNVGSLLHNQCSKHMIRTSLELGGNAPFIVFEDADIDDAVEQVTAAKMRNMGEACTAANRVLIHEEVEKEFTTKLATRFSQLRVGNGLEEGVDVGPMIDRPNCERLQDMVDDAKARGAQVVLGGEISPDSGAFYPPTILSNVSRDAELAYEELFGPVVPIFTFNDEDDAIAFANDTRYGLAGYVMTEKLSRAMRVSSKLEIGMIGLNTGIISDVAAPLGGVKASGLGHEGGILGIDEFLEYKYTFIPHS